MAIEIIPCEQRSPEWFEARRGIPTASMFGVVMAQGKGSAESKGRASYMRKLAGEIITKIPMVSYTNDDMERGVLQEPEILARYCFEQDVEVTSVGFIKNGFAGCSPDGLVGKDGLVQIKSAAPHVMIDILMHRDYPPTKHLPQCQGELMVTERKWTDLVIGSSPMLPLARWRLQRDERYILEIKGHVATFVSELRAMVKKIESMT